MFNQKYQKQIKRIPIQPMLPDINRPSVHPGYYGHPGRVPNTNYSAQSYEYRQHADDVGLQEIKGETQRLLQEKISAQYTNHINRKIFHAKVQSKVELKLKEYDADVQRRREKLKEILCQEEQAYYVEVIDTIQKAEAFKLEELKKHNAEIKAKREAERLKIVEAKRFQLFKNNCPEYRPAVEKYNLIQSKNGQLQQIKEKEELKEAERELDQMWHQLLLKELDAKEEREKQELLKRYKTKQEMLDAWEKQMQGIAELKKEQQRIAAEDKEEMTKLMDQVEREYIESVEADKRRKEQTARELAEQLALRQKVLDRMKAEEDALDESFARLNREEVEKEKQGIVNSTKFAKKEMATYMNSLKELEKQRKEEERKLDQLLMEYQKAIEAKQVEAKCKLVLAKRKLQQEVIDTVAQQLEYKRKEAENQLRMKQAENELLRIDCEIYEKSCQEAALMDAQAAALYREDLREQIAENCCRRKKQCHEKYNELDQSLEEEKLYKQLVERLITESIRKPCKHPFTAVLEKQGPCPRFINK